MDLQLFRMLTSRSRSAVTERYEPWVYDAFDQFEREIEAFCRRSLFSVVI